MPAVPVGQRPPPHFPSPPTAAPPPTHPQSGQWRPIPSNGRVSRCSPSHDRGKPSQPQPRDQPLACQGGRSPRPFFGFVWHNITGADRGSIFTAQAPAAICSSYASGSIRARDREGEAPAEPGLLQRFSNRIRVPRFDSVQVVSTVRSGTRAVPARSGRHAPAPSSARPPPSEAADRRSAAPPLSPR